MNPTDYHPGSPFPRGLSGDAVPVSFGNPAGEAATCRNAASLFDYSFLLRVAVTGPGALAAVSRFCGRDFSDLPGGRIRYALSVDAIGHLVSDLTVWRTGPEHLEVMSGRATDVEALDQITRGRQARIDDLSDHTGVLAVQGPGSVAAMRAAGCGGTEGIASFAYADLEVGGIACRVARLGFTGLDGFEILCPGDRASELWALLSRIAPPAGFEAADRLRLAAGLPLFTHEFRPPVSARDAGYEHIRSLGDTPADTRLARVRRISFRAGFLDSAHPGPLVNLLWHPGDPFPPAPGEVAVTSLARDERSGKLLGMGYIGSRDVLGTLRDTSGLLRFDDWSLNRFRAG